MRRECRARGACHVWAGNGREAFLSGNALGVVVRRLGSSLDRGARRRVSRLRHRPKTRPPRVHLTPPRPPFFFESQQCCPTRTPFRRRPLFTYGNDLLLFAFGKSNLRAKQSRSAPIAPRGAVATTDPSGRAPADAPVSRARTPASARRGHLRVGKARGERLRASSFGPAERPSKQPWSRRGAPRR